jgi:hypothetical protein
LSVTSTLSWWAAASVRAKAIYAGSDGVAVLAQPS